MDPTCKLAASRVVSVWPNPPKGPTDPSQTIRDSDVMNEVITNGGCTVGQIDPSEEEHNYVFQRNESNLRFLRRLAARNGMYVRTNPTDGSVDVVKLQVKGSAVDIAKGDVIALDYTYSPKALPPQITTYGWDYVTKEMIEGTASSGDIDTIGSGTNAVDNPVVWQGESAYLSDVQVSSQGMAKTLAVAELNRMARSFLRGKAIVAQNAALRSGVSVKFEGHREGFNAEGYVLSTRHRWYMNGDATTEVLFCANTYADGGGGGGAGDALAGTPVAQGGGNSPGGGLGGLGGALGGGDVAGFARSMPGGESSPLGDVLSAAGDSGFANAMPGGEGGLGDLGSALEGRVGEFGDNVEGIASGLGDNIVSGVQSNLEGAADALMSGDLDGAAQGLENAMNVPGDQAAAAAGQVLNETSSLISDSAGMVTDAVGQEVQGVADQIAAEVDLTDLPMGDKLNDELNDALADAGQQVTDALDEALEEPLAEVDQALAEANGQIQNANDELNQEIDAVMDPIIAQGAQVEEDAKNFLKDLNPFG